VTCIQRGWPLVCGFLKAMETAVGGHGHGHRQAGPRAADEQGVTAGGGIVSCDAGGGNWAQLRKMKRECGRPKNGGGRETGRRPSQARGPKPGGS
jgi:hypothetical protein